MGDGVLGAKVDVAKLAGEISNFPGELARQESKRLGDLGDRIVEGVRQELQRGPSGAGGRASTTPHSSREQAGRGVKAKVKDGELSITSDSSGMAPGREAFPASYGLATWSHPVFGNPNNMVSQRGRPWFTKVIRSFESETESAFREAGQSALDTIKGDQ